MRLQGLLPLNPAGMSAVAPDLTFNTAVSFATNTNWQNYGGESTLSYLTQMVGLTTQNFVSAATGIALAVALIRGFARASAKTVGNFWVDLTRCTLYVLLPLSIIAAHHSGLARCPAEPRRLCRCNHARGRQADDQPRAGGLADRHQAARHQWRRLLERQLVAFLTRTRRRSATSSRSLYILLISAALTHTFGRMVKDERQGWAIYAVMSILFLAGLVVCYWAEGSGNPQFAALGLDPANMEGKEVRFGIANSSLWAVATTDASNGSVNSMHDSFTPLGGMIPMLNIQLGEIIYGGVGSGLYGMLLMVIIAVFVAGLMVGRTPEYLGKKIEAKEVKMAMLAILMLPLVDALLHGRGRGALVRRVQHGQCRPAWLQRGFVSLHLADRKQRLGLRRHHRQYALVQHDRRHRHADRTLLHHHPDDGSGGLAGGKEDSARLDRNLPDPWRPLRRPARSA